jgi:ABC-2 type transport system ATP-binding protein
VISSHDLQHTFEVSDRIIALDKGLLVKDVLTRESTFQELESFFATESV